MTGWILSPIRRWWGQCLLPHVYERGGFYARGEFIRPARSVELRWKGKVLRENGTKDVGYWCSVELIRCRTRLSTWPKGCSQYVCSRDWCRYRDCPGQARLGRYVDQAECDGRLYFSMLLSTQVSSVYKNATGYLNALRPQTKWQCSCSCPTKLCTQLVLLRHC
jgi:hypothetical protein